MPKTKAPKRTRKSAVPPKLPAIDPKRVHELLGIPGPYDPVPPPPDRPNALTFWDPGCSIKSLLAKAPDLFHKNVWFESEPFAKTSDSWRWRQITLVAAEPGEPFADQEAKLKPDEQPPFDRELVAYLIVLALATGRRPEVRKLRCRDVLPSGRRVYVGNFGSFGLEIGNVSDRWVSPGLALSAVHTPDVPRKKK